MASDDLVTIHIPLDPLPGSPLPRAGVRLSSWKSLGSRVLATSPFASPCPFWPLPWQGHPPSGAGGQGWATCEPGTWCSHPKKRSRYILSCRTRHTPSDFLKCVLSPALTQRRLSQISLKGLRAHVPPSLSGPHCTGGPPPPRGKCLLSASMGRRHLYSIPGLLATGRCSATPLFLHTLFRARATFWSGPWRSCLLIESRGF